jgi:hypothetical protein
MPDYLSQRQNALTQDPAEKTVLNTYLEAVADQFGLPWLERSGGSPLQELWKARYAQATNEMLILGHAVRNLMAANPGWIKHQISQMKIGSVGERSGAAFEIIGLDLFSGPGQRIVPAPANRPGYDGSVVFDDGSSLMVSIKNHGITSHETAFQSKAEEMRAGFVDSLRKARANPGRMTAIATRHPTTADWAALRQQLRDLSENRFPEDSPVWNWRVDPLPAEWSPLSPDHTSYGFMLAAPFHQNEQKNFQENIRKGIVNLEKQCGTVKPNVCRTLLMRLSATASMSECRKWVDDYFVQYPETKVELIMLYQAVPATDLKTNKTSITHFFLPLPGPNFARWQAGGPSRRFAIHPLIGTVQSSPTETVLFDGDTARPFPAHYVFQRADVFHYYDPSKAPVNATLHNPAPGVFHHAVIAGATISMRASEDGRLLLLP